MKNNKAPRKELLALWAKIPNMVDCKGKCHTSCGPVPLTEVEHQPIRARGKEMEVKDGLNGAMTCSLLTRNGSCEVYSVRPLMCRIWGAARTLPCPYGCKPERYLSDYEVFQIMEDAAEILGEPPEAAMDNMLKILGPELAKTWHKEVGDVAKKAARISIETGKPLEYREG